MKRFFSERNRRSCLHHGSILLMVLVAIILLTLTTSTYLLLMRNEHLAAHYSGKHLQAATLAESGVEYLRVLLSQTPSEIEQQGGLLDNPETLQDVLVIDEQLANYRGRFTVVAPDMNQGYYQNLRYGLENESAKLNLNSLIEKESLFEETDDAAGEEGFGAAEEKMTPHDRLLLLPGMNEAVADAILDWLDEDDSPRTNGAESDYYLGLTPAYQPRNGPLAHLDELLMIQGVTTELLYGVDANQNYQIDTDELPRGALEQLDNTNGELDRGWSAYLTVHSLEKNMSPSGEPKINLNAKNLRSLHGKLQQTLGTAEADFIIVFRQFGPSGETTNGVATGSEGPPIDFEKPGDTKIESILDLIGVQVRVENEENENDGADGGADEEDGDDDGEDEDVNSDESADGEENQAGQTIESPWQDNAGSYSQAFAELLDVATVDPGKRVAGRININRASLPVLLTIPGMTETLADQIIAQRDRTAGASGSEQRHPTWLIAEGLLTLDDLKPMFPWITTGGDVYSGQVIGYFDAGTARARVQVILDHSGEPTRLLQWRDLSPLGPGFSRTVLSDLVQPDE